MMERFPVAKGKEAALRDKQILESWVRGYITTVKARTEMSLNNGWFPYPTDDEFRYIARNFGYMRKLS